MIRRFLIRYAGLVALSLLLILVVTALYFFHAVLLPFILAVFLAYLIAPIIGGIHRIPLGRRRIHRGVAILVTYMVFLGGLFLTGRFVVPSLVHELNRIVKELPHMLVQVERTWITPLERDVDAWLAEFMPSSGEEVPTDMGFAPDGGPAAPPSETAEPPPERPPWQVLIEDYTYVVRQLDDNRFEVAPRKRTQAHGDGREPLKFRRPINAVFEQVRSTFEENLFELIGIGRRHLTTVVGSFFTAFLVFMISAFILVDPDRIWNFLRTLVPPKYHREFDDLIQRFDRGLSGVVRGQLMICVINGVLTGIGLLILKVPFTLTLTLLATIFSLIPIFGVLISSVPIVLMASSVSMSTALAAVGWILGIHFIEGNFLNPKIMGAAAKIHPVLIIFALLVGQYTAGVIGALIAVPIFSLVQNSFLFVQHFVENLEAKA